MDQSATCYAWRHRKHIYRCYSNVYNPVIQLEFFDKIINIPLTFKEDQTAGA